MNVAVSGVRTVGWALVLTPIRLLAALVIAPATHCPA